MRSDISNNLIHLVKNNVFDNAGSIFFQILKDEKLNGGIGFIKDGYRCVCFSETPIHEIARMFTLENQTNIRYRPFGIMVSKEWLYAQGGRPVVYQPDNEYLNLPEDMRYRHVRYEPDNDKDFTWEREWRIKTDSLILDPDETTLIVPNKAWIVKLREEHYNTLRMAVSSLGGTALGYIQRYKWHFIALEDLGIKVFDYD